MQNYQNKKSEHKQKYNDNTKFYLVLNIWQSLNKERKQKIYYNCKRCDTQKQLIRFMEAYYLNNHFEYLNDINLYLSDYEYTKYMGRAYMKINK